MAMVRSPGAARRRVEIGEILRILGMEKRSRLAARGGESRCGPAAIRREHDARVNEIGGMGQAACSRRRECLQLGRGIRAIDREVASTASSRQPQAAQHGSRRR